MTPSDPYLHLKQFVAILYILILVALAAAVLVRLTLALFPEFY